MKPDDWLELSAMVMVFLLKIVCFLLGYLISKEGAELLRCGVKGEFKFASSLIGAKADLASASPGLLFVLLGVWLIGFAMWVDKPVKSERTKQTVQVYGDAEKVRDALDGPLYLPPHIELPPSAASK